MVVNMHDAVVRNRDEPMISMPRASALVMPTFMPDPFSVGRANSTVLADHYSVIHIPWALRFVMVANMHDPLLHGRSDSTMLACDYAKICMTWAFCFVMASMMGNPVLLGRANSTKLADYTIICKTVFVIIAITRDPDFEGETWTTFFMMVTAMCDPPSRPRTDFAVAARDPSIVRMASTIQSVMVAIMHDPIALAGADPTILARDG